MMVLRTTIRSAWAGGAEMGGAPEQVETIEARRAELTTSLSRIAGIDPRLASDLASLGLTNVGRLIAHLPMRHEREEEEAPIESLAPGSVISARGEVTASRVSGFGRKARFEAVLHDGTGRLDLVWFNAPYMRHTIKPGMRLRVQGKGGSFRGGVQIVNPSIEILDDDGDEPEARGERLRPVYPASERVNSRAIERAVSLVLGSAVAQIDDHLGEAFRRERELPSLSEAYRMMHAPESEREVAEARRRLAYDELLLLQLGVAMKREHLRRTLKAPALRWDDAIDKHIRERLPFSLTPGQDKVVREIAQDLSTEVPTNRMVQGDVGSGKTLVALYAMLMAVASERQAALMAPTEILAEQHFASISEMLRGSRVSLALLTGTTPAPERASTLERLASGELDLVIGTHALLTESVAFKSLGVAIIDEQHRFGVRQRALLRTKGMGDGGLTTPHVIVMTATPIPRTIAITLFGDLDVSTITGMPPGRQPVETRVLGQDRRDEVYTFVRTRVERGEQAYVVAPAIDTGQSAGGALKDLRSLVKELEDGPLSGLRIAALHGRLKRSTRERVMGRFREGLIDVLIATTVIEVGVDVPNATVMVVEHAERFGLAQLHQLRGRVGRGGTASVCVLIGEAQTPDGAQRLGVMATTSDGFALAELDLEIRGPGEVFGARQAGAAPFKVADLRRDVELLAMARRDARAWIEASPTLDRPEDALARRRLLKAHGESLGLGDVA